MGNAAAPGLTADEIRDLREIAGAMIPPDPALGMPGADDPDILADPGVVADGQFPRPVDPDVVPDQHPLANMGAEDPQNRYAHP